jgi:uncharacterized protein
MIVVEVVYAQSPERQVLRSLRLAEGASAAEALAASGLFEACPELRQSEPQIGIHGRLIERDTALRDGDRVEIYRPLEVDPKEARRSRAEERRRAR